MEVDQGLLRNSGARDLGSVALSLPPGTAVSNSQGTTPLPLSLQPIQKSVRPCGLEECPGWSSLTGSLWALPHPPLLFSSCFSKTSSLNQLSFQARISELCLPLFRSAVLAFIWSPFLGLTSWVRGTQEHTLLCSQGLTLSVFKTLGSG